VLPRVKVAALDVLVIVKSGSVAVLTVTDPEDAVASPPPTMLAVFVSDAAASLATEAVILIAG
jgi:hypothetical protein